MVFAIHWHESAMGVHVFHILNPAPIPPHPISLGCPSAPALSALFHASNMDWWSISHMVIYMFQCYSLKSSCPRLVPQSPKFCSLSLCFFCCLTYRVIFIIFLNYTYIYIYMCINILYWCFSFWPTSLCIIGSSFIHLIKTDSNAFLLMAEYYSIVYMYMYHKFLIHS